MAKKKKLTGKFVGMEYREDGMLPVKGIARFEDENWFKWNNTGTKLFYDDAITKVLKVYDGDYREFEKFQKLYVEFVKEFDAVTPYTGELFISHSWISPDGDWYPCSYAEHWNMAERILACNYGIKGFYTTLLADGWMKMYEDGYIVYQLDIVPDKLKEFLVKLSKLNKGYWHRNIVQFLKDYNT